MSTGVGTRLLYNLLGESLKMAHIADLMIILILRVMFQALAEKRYYLLGSPKYMRLEIT